MHTKNVSYSSVFGVNTKALVNITQIVIKNLLTRQVPGAIVNLSSQASLAGLMHHTVYCSSKVRKNIQFINQYYLFTEVYNN